MRKIILLLILLVMLVGCQWSNSVFSLNSTPTVDLLLIVDTKTSTSIPTSTASPTHTPIVRATATFTPTQNNDLCPMPLPTLVPLERDIYFETVINDETCSFPCFLGLNPGEEITDALVPLASIYHTCYYEDNFTTVDQLSHISVPIYGVPYESENPLDFNSSFGWVRLHLYHQDSQIQMIYANITDAMQSITHTPILTKYTRYDLTNIVNEYGQPDKVVVDMGYYTAVAYSVFLYYEENSTIVIIGGVAALSDPMRICPVVEQNWNGKITQIRVLTSTPAYYAILEELITEFQSGSDRAKPISELGYSIEEFTEIILSSNPADRCFNIPQSLWEE